MANFVDTQDFQLPSDWEQVYQVAYRKGWQDDLNLPQVQAGQIALDQTLLRQRWAELEKALAEPLPTELDYTALEEGELWRQALRPLRPRADKTERDAAIAELIRRLGQTEFNTEFRRRAMKER